MKKLLVLFAFVLPLVLSARSGGHSPGVTENASGAKVTSGGYSYCIIHTNNNTWGYDIYFENSLFIHQDCVPGLPGNDGFKTKAAAVKAARLMISKFEKGIMPPGVIKDIPAGAPNTWTQKANVGGPGRQDAVGFSIGAKGYIGTGIDLSNTRHNDFWEYDPVTNAWTQKANFGGTPRVSAGAFSVGDKGYIGAGQEQSGMYKKDFWEYNPVTNTWTQKADIGGLVRWQPVCFSIGNRGYMGTGWSPAAPGGGGLKDLWEYNPSANSWTQKADFGGGVRASMVGFSIGQKGYAGTGLAENGVYQKDFWEYDPATDQWTQKADFGGSPRVFATGFSIGDKGYLGMGDTLGPAFSKVFYEYDTCSDTWTRKADFIGLTAVGPVGFCIGTNGYVGTGSPLTATSGFWEYAPGCSFPAPPANITPPANQTICAGTGTVLYAAGCGTLGWYSDETGGNWLGGGTSFTTPLLNSNTTYYVQDSNSCGASQSRRGIPVTVNAIPVPSIAGPAGVCVNIAYSEYTTQPGMSNYMWTVSPGGIIINGSGTSLIQVSWVMPGADTVRVTYTYGQGCNAPAPAALNVTVNPVPATPAVTSTGNILYSSAPLGNQWFYEGNPIAGATAQTYDASLSGSGYYWTVVTLAGCSSDSSNNKQIFVTGTGTQSPATIRMYPVPSNGRFTIHITTASEEDLTLRIYNCIGLKVREEAFGKVAGSVEKTIDLGPIPAGVYSVIIETGKNRWMKKILLGQSFSLQGE